MVKRLTIWGGIGIILVILSQILLPLAIAGGIERALQAVVKTEQIVVQANKFPALLMLWGNFDLLTVQATNVQTERIAFSEFDLRLEQVQIDLAKLWQSKTLSLQAVQNVKLQAAVTNQELAELINKKIKGAKNAEVTITPERVTVRSTLVLGKMVNAVVVLEGKIIASDNRIVFTTEQFKIDNPLIGKFGGAIFTDLVLADFKDLPFAVQVKNIVLEDGKVVIQADNAKLGDEDK